MIVHWQYAHLHFIKISSVVAEKSQGQGLHVGQNYMLPVQVRASKYTTQKYM